MALLEFPNPGEIYNSFKSGALDRDSLNALLSAMYSSYISGLWAEGSSKWAIWTGAGQGMKDMATATYLSMEPLQKKGFLCLTVPQELLDPNNLARFQTRLVVK